MGTRRRRARIARSALVLTVAGSMLVGAGARYARASESVDVGPTDSGPQCLTNYYADGTAIVVAGILEIPYQNVAGGPYTAAVITAQPDSRALATEYYEGYAGEVVLGTSGVYHANPTGANAYWPKPLGGHSADQHDDGPFARTTAYAEPRKAVSDARAFAIGSPDGANGGQSLSHSDATYDGKTVSGTEEAIGYNINLGALHIDWLRSVVNWSMDGTPGGAVGTWKLDFHGVRNANTGVYSFSGDGFSVQGGTANPGEANRKAFNDQQKKFSDALEGAGIGQADFQLQPGTATVTGDHLDIKGAGIMGRLAPKVTRGKTTSAGAVELGRVEEHVRASQGSCDLVGSPPPFSQEAPPTGPNPPKFPPDHCTQNGCTPQTFPPALPGAPGGKQSESVPSLGVTAPAPAAPASAGTPDRTLSDVLRLLPVSPPAAAAPASPPRVTPRG
ncbi:MAG TPA: hypothetical protein VH134_04915 [Candidatus Dormibacteraeota bacterium]|nr:hypothetical protein [Candidatus Dormibacteraeota bacterium]